MGILKKIILSFLKSNSKGSLSNEPLNPKSSDFPVTRKKAYSESFKIQTYQWPEVKAHLPLIDYNGTLRTLEYGFQSGNNLGSIRELKEKHSKANFTVLMTAIAKHYLKGQYHLNSNNLDLTFYLLKNFLPQQKSAVANFLINNYPLQLSVTDLKFIFSFVEIFFELPHRPILLTIYLAKDFEKFSFFYNIGCTIDVLYRSVKITTQDGESPFDAFLIGTLTADSQYVGLPLFYVILCEHPELIPDRRSNNVSN